MTSDDVRGDRKVAQTSCVHATKSIAWATHDVGMHKSIYMNWHKGVIAQTWTEDVEIQPVRLVCGIYEYFASVELFYVRVPQNLQHFQCMRLGQHPVTRHVASQCECKGAPLLLWQDTLKTKSSLWWICHHWWHWRLSSWQPPMPPMMTKLASWQPPMPPVMTKLASWQPPMPPVMTKLASWQPPMPPVMTKLASQEYNSPRFCRCDEWCALGIAILLYIDKGVPVLSAGFQ